MDQVEIRDRIMEECANDLENLRTGDLMAAIPVVVQEELERIERKMRDG